MFIVGEKGSGKTALLSRAVELVCRAFPQAQTVVRFAGSTPSSSTAERLLRSFCQEICRRYGKDESRVPSSLEELAPLFDRLLALASEQTPLFIFLDGMDALSKDGTVDRPGWLPDRLPPDARLILSGTAPATGEIELASLTSDECTELLAAWLKGEGRKLGPGQWRVLLRAVEKQALPAYAKLAFEQARKWRSYEPAVELRLPGPTGIAGRAPKETAVKNKNPIAEQERRQSPRVALETCVNLASDSNFYTGFSEDISDGGLFVATYSLQPIGTSISITFGLPGGHSVTASGRVRWVRDVFDLYDDTSPGMGIAFEELPLEGKELVEQFMLGRTPLFYVED